jgi:hypothetical protein
VTDIAETLDGAYHRGIGVSVDLRHPQRAERLRLISDQPGTKYRVSTYSTLNDWQCGAGLSQPSIPSIMSQPEQG